MMLPIDKIWSFEAKLEQLLAMIAAVQNALAQAGLDETFSYGLHLALEEALANVIHYAYPDSCGRLDLRLLISKEHAVEIEIADQGVPFNPCEERDPDLGLDANERKVGGLGIFLIRKNTDQVSYRRVDGKNILTLKKQL